MLDGCCDDYFLDAVPEARIIHNEYVGRINIRLKAIESSPKNDPISQEKAINTLVKIINYTQEYRHNMEKLEKSTKHSM